MTTDDSTKLRRLTKSEREWLRRKRLSHEYTAVLFDSEWKRVLLKWAESPEKCGPIPPSLLRRYARNLRPRRDPWAEQTRKRQYTKRPAVTRDDADAGRLIAQAAQEDLT